jgi:hypothetical protein
MAAERVEQRAGIVPERPGLEHLLKYRLPVLQDAQVE